MKEGSYSISLITVIFVLLCTLVSVSEARKTFLVKDAINPRTTPKVRGYDAEFCL